jgi:hypothetical protein
LETISTGTLRASGWKVRFSTVLRMVIQRSNCGNDPTSLARLWVVERLAPDNGHRSYIEMAAHPSEA